MRKFRDPGRESKALQPGDTSVDQRLDIFKVSGYRSRPKPHVNIALAFCGPPLRLKVRYRCRWWNTIQRHINQRCHATGRRRLRCSFESLPLGSTGFVNMNMGIDETRHNNRLASVHELAPEIGIDPFRNGFDPAIAYMNGCRRDAAVSNH